MDITICISIGNFAVVCVLTTGETKRGIDVRETIGNYLFRYDHGKNVFN